MRQPLTQVVYDNACPICRAYCQMAKENAPAKAMTLVDARQPSELMQEITRRGLDIDQGMVVKFEGELFYGADAISLMARLSSKSGIFNRLTRILFSHRRGAMMLYPALRSVRNLLLKALGVPKVNNLKRAGNDRF